MLHLVACPTGGANDQPGGDGGPGHGQHQRNEKSHDHRHRQRPEESARHAIEKSERNEHHDRRQRAADKGRADFVNGLADRLCGGMPGFDLRINCFYNHDGVVDDKPDDSGDAAQRHQVETHPQEPHSNQREQHSHGDDRRGDHRHRPIPQKRIQHQYRQPETDENAFPDAFNTFPDELRLVVKERQPHVRRQILLQFLQLHLQVVGDRHRVAVGLPIDVEQHRLAAVRRDPVELRRFSRAHDTQIANFHRRLPRPGDDDVFDFTRVTQPVVDDAEIQLIVLLVHSGGGELVGVAQGLINLIHRQVVRIELGRVEDDVPFGDSPPNHVDPSHALDPQEPRINVIAGLLPQVCDFPRLAAARQTDANNGKRREGETVHLNFGGHRQGVANLGQPGQHEQFRLDHVGLPVEEHVDRRRTPRGRRADVHRTGNVLHRFFDGSRDGGHHLVARHHAVVDEDHHPRKVGVRKD